MAEEVVNTDRPKSSTLQAIVGIGSASGGLKALEQFFAKLPTDLGIAIVVVQHVNTEGSNVLTDLVSRMSPLPVRLFQNPQLPVEANCVYVVPERRQAELTGDGLVVSKIKDPAHRAAVIDVLFQSFASRSEVPIVGIILSGQGSDGTLGIKAISGAGGMTIVQDEDSAEHEEMPLSAARVGHADHVLRPADMADVLQDYVRHVATLHRKADAQNQYKAIESELPRICDVLLETAEHDFRHYKTNTLVRRVSRRMQTLRLSSAEDYLRQLQESREEAHTLFRDLLISVTAFFRDPDTFAALENQVIPRLIEDAKKDQPVRIWVSGCATGEEAYTLAILMREALDNCDKDFEVRIFATDIDSRALNVARTGSYSISIADQLTEHRLKRFFNKTGDQYTVVKELRDMCVFSVHNLISDPPYSQMDLISCRNLLIYLGQHLQLKLIPLFHFVLRPRGYLLLGPSENLSSHKELFRPVDQKHRISQRIAAPTQSVALLSQPAHLRSQPLTSTAAASHEVDIHQISQRIVLDEFAPCYAVVNEEAHLICSSPGLERYFEFPVGPFQNNVVKLARQGLRSGLRATLREARESLRTVKRENLTLKTAEGTERIELVVQPMPEVGEQNDLFMLVFRDLGSPTQRSTTEDADKAHDDESRITELERELDQTRLDLENVVQDLESSNEELKSSNEELLSINEEWQSANEELKASKEEVQVGMEALARAQSDLQNLLDGTNIATIYLDSAGSIRSFTPSAAEIYSLKKSDVGRPLNDITHKAIEMPSLPDFELLAASAEPGEQEIQAGDDRWFLRRVLPYRDDDRPTGVILTFVDISAQKRAEFRLTAAHEIALLLADAETFDEVASQVLEVLRDNLGAEVCMLWLRDKRAKDLYCSEISVEPNATRVRPFVDRGRELRLQKGEGIAGHVWETQQPYRIASVADDPNFIRKELAKECGLVTGMAMPIISGKRFYGAIEYYADHIIPHEQSLTDLLGEVGSEIGHFIRAKRLDERFRDEEARKAAILETALDCVITMDLQGRIVDFNSCAEQTFGFAKEDVAGRQLADVIIPKRFHDTHQQGMKRFLETGESEIVGKRIELTAQRADGSEFPIELAVSVAHSREGAPFFTGYLRDITERKQWEDALRDSEGRSNTLIAASAQIVWTTNSKGEVVEDSPTWRAFTGQSFEEFKGNGWADMLHPEDREPTLQTWRKATKKRKPLKLDYRVRHASGEWRWTAVRAVPQLREDGSVIRWVGMNTDITKQKQLELHSKQEAEDDHFLSEASMILNKTLDYEETLANITEICVPTLADWAFIDLLDEAGETRRVKVAHADPADHDLAAQVAKFPAKPGSCDHPPARGLFGGEAFLISEFTDEMLQKAAQCPEHEKVMLQVGPKSFIVVPLVVRGKSFGALTLIATQSGRKYSSKELNLATELARRAATAVDNARLYHTAEQANRAKSRFLANVSHEIRSPMTAILGYADLLAAKENDLEKANFLQIIKRNGNSLLDILNDILDFSKLEAGKLKILRERFVLHRVIADVHSTMAARAREKGLEFEVQYEGKIPAEIESDAKRVRQVLVNLVGNAIKFTKSGSVRLAVQYTSDSDEPMIRFDVTDTGIGITQQQRGKLFKSFSQGDASVDREFGGTGLGLAISRSLARRLGGDLTFTSVPGEGSTFSFTIPTGTVEDAELIEPEAGQIALQIVPQWNNQRLACRVLVVDDRRDVRFLSQRILTEAGAEVSLAEDGVEALEKVTKGNAAGLSWDVVILDMQMPRLNGYQTALRLRTMGFQGTIIALTADAMHGDQEMCLNSGCDTYLSKPINSEELVDLVARYTKNSSGQVSARETPPEESPTALNRSRVLIVDDAVDACTAMRKLLEMEGFEVETAYDGASAFAAAARFNPAAVLLDLKLPDMSGYDVLQRLKGLSELHGTKFIAVTGDGRAHDVNHWQSVGFDHHLTKPADLEELLSLLRTVN